MDQLHTPWDNPDKKVYRSKQEYLKDSRQGANYDPRQDVHTHTNSIHTPALCARTCRSVLRVSLPLACSGAANARHCSLLALPAVAVMVGPMQPGLLAPRYLPCCAQLHPVPSPARCPASPTWHTHAGTTSSWPGSRCPAPTPH
jgi:hypothetical protein